MVSLVKNIPIASLSLRGLLPLLLLVLCIVALFFVPDLIKLSKQLDPSAVAKRAVEETQKLEQVVSEKIAEVPLPEIIQRPKEVSPLDDVLVSFNKQSVAADQSVAQGFKVPGSEPLTWDILRGESAQAALSKARTEANSILSQLPDVEVEARQALVSMIAAIDFVGSDGAKVITAQEAADQLQTADVAVAASLQVPGIDRSLYLKWMDVSLTPAILDYRAERIKYQMMHPFDPMLRLQEVEVAKIDPQQGVQQRINSRLVMYGSVRGNDIKDLRLYRNGVYVQEILFSQPDERGLRSFSFAKEQAYGLWTFKATDSKGGTYEKSYRFFPRIERFPRDGFTYVLPFDTSQLDPRLDRLFRVSEKKGPEPGELSDLESF